MSGKLMGTRQSASRTTMSRRLFAALVLVVAVLSTACTTSNVLETSVEAGAAAGSDSGASTTVDESSNNSAPAPTAAPDTTDTAPVSATAVPRPPAAPTPAGSTGGGGTAPAVGIGACPVEFIGSGTYIVTNIEANDPDGGLVGHSAPAVDAPSTNVLPADFGVWVDGTPQSCAVTEAGAVWWSVNTGEGNFDWVNAYYLGYYEGPGNRPVVGGTQLCDSYQLLLEAQETDIPVTKALISIDVELGGHPTGVTNAIQNMVNGFSTDWYSDLSTIQAYLDPTCTGIVSPNPPSIDEPQTGGDLPPVIQTDADYWFAVELCWFDADPWSCDQLEVSGYSFNDNWGLGNSVSQTPWEFVVDTCAANLLESQFHCREAWSRFNYALDGTAQDYLGMCGQIATLALDPTKPTYHLDWALSFFSWDIDTQNAIAAIYNGTGDGNSYDVMQAAFVSQCEGCF